MKEKGIDWEKKDDPNKTGPSSNDSLSGDHKWYKNVELSLFEGSDPIGWISRDEKFFDTQQVLENERLQLAFISMEGRGVHSFRFLQQRNVIMLLVVFSNN